VLQAIVTKPIIAFSVPDIQQLPAEGSRRVFRD